LNWFLFWLLLHIAAAIIGLGPTFVFPLIGSLLEKNPQNAHFAVELMHKLETGLILPVALTLIVSGTGLIIADNVNLLASTYLLVAVVLYLAALAIVFLNQLPATSKLLQLTAGGPPPGAAPGPPPPEVAALINRAKVGGMVLTVLLLTIIFLMVIKPGGIHHGAIFG
jgi:hypothetical protein